MPLGYTGIDIVEPMIAYGRREFDDAGLILGDVFDLDAPQPYDFVVCNGVLTLRLDVTYPAMERYWKSFVLAMFALCRHGIAFNMMSTRGNYMADHLDHQSPAEVLAWLYSEVSPRVRLDHGCSCPANGRGKLYEFTADAYRD